MKELIPPKSPHSPMKSVFFAAVGALCFHTSPCLASITGIAESGLNGDTPAVIATNFAEDSPTFSDRSHQHNGAAFNGNTLSTGGGTIVPLPGYLLGGDYVRFANDARENASYSATVTTDVSSDFYLLVDNRLNGPAGSGGSANTSDPVLGGTLQWVIDDGWQRVNTGISPGGQADYTGVDEGGNAVGAGQGLNQFYSVYKFPSSETSVSVNGPAIGGNNMIALVVVPAGGGGGPDSDDDGLLDAWEIAEFGDLDEDDNGDFDNDGLTNLQEFNTGADPTEADSDSDGLDDGAEFNIHNTDPTDDDSDGDGLLDGAEVNSHSTDPNDADSDDDSLSDSLEINTHSTDPNLADSDDDGFSDPVEISAGSDPNDDQSVPDFSNLDGVIINEFMATNNAALLDEDGDSSDWIELWNTETVAVDITGWHLSDDPLNLSKWTLPAQVMSPNQFLVVFASGKDRSVPGAELHTDFQLDKAGGSFLALSRPDGAGGTEIVSVFDPYGRQYEDVSFGLYGDTPPLPSGFFQNPTPGAPNDQNAVAGFVADTSFSIDRGFYDAPFDVVIASETPGASIIYTTDGTLPSESPPNGTRIDAPDANTPPAATVNITTTTNLRALAVKTGFEPTNVDTHSYIFRSDVLQQSNASVPPHANWGHAGPDFEMDPQIVNHSNPEVRPTPDDFLRVPTVSLTMDWDTMFGSSGIYIAGEGVDRPTSIEYINPEESLSEPNLAEGFQVDGTVRIVGGSSTGRWKSDKLSMRLKFSPDLRFPVFGPDRTDRFDTLVLDHRLNNVWHYNRGTSQSDRAQYTRDQFPADLQTLMGGLAPEGRHCLLYINGVFWGITELHERPDDNFAAQYLGGDNDDYDAMKHRTSTVVAGTSTNYNAMLNLSRQDMANPANYQALADVLDLENFIAYMISNYYVGNTDWAHQNWYATYNRVAADGRWRYHSWDPEHCMENTNQDVTNKDNSGGPTEVFVNLMGSPEFKLRFADAVHRHFHNDGVLTPANAAAAYMRRADAVDLITRLESARWGDNSVSDPYTRLDWLQNRNQLLGTQGGSSWSNYFPTRTGIVLNQFRNRGWYPDTDAPDFSPHGGKLPNNSPLDMNSADGGTIYYTTDGSDPRVPASGGGGESSTTELVAEDAVKFAMMPTDSSLDSTWMAASFDHSSWASGTLGAGYENSPGEYTPLIDANFDFLGQVNSSTQETIFMRIPFTASGVADFGSMTLKVRYDDGFVAYLNGTEIARANSLGNPGTPDAFNANASTSHSDSLAVQWQSFNVGSHVGLLQEGANVLAIHGLNRNTGSSDMLITATLEASDAPTSGGTVSPTAIAYGGTLTLGDSATIRARVLNNGEWSPLTEARFIVGTVPADSGNLAVTELNYRPASPDAAELAAGHNDRSDFEFLELTNISPTEKVDLSGVRFTSGIDFEFDSDASIIELAPGESLLIVEDAAAFEFRHGAGLPVAGIFQNGTQLSNGGETITLVNTSLAPPGDVIRDFTYDDAHPWPTAPDGDGLTLTLIDPNSNPDHSLAANWRSSVSGGGSPGSSDATSFAVWSASFGGVQALDDDDEDGLASLVEYAMGTSPLSPEHAPPSPELSGDFLTLRFQSNKAADDVTLVAEGSSDLGTWSSVEIISRTDNGDGTETLTARAPADIHADPNYFLRLRATLKP